MNKTRLITEIRCCGLTPFNHEGYVSLRLPTEWMWNLAPALHGKFKPPTVIGFTKGWVRNPSNEEILLSWLDYPWED